MLEQLARRLRHIGHGFAHGARLMVGVQDYDHYVARTRANNPHAPVMSRRQFIDYCQNRRLNGKGSRCC